MAYHIPNGFISVQKSFCLADSSMDEAMKQ